MNFTTKKKLEGMEQALVEAGKTEAVLRMKLASLEARQKTYTSCNEKFSAANEKLKTRVEELERSNRILSNKNSILESKCSEAEAKLLEEISRKCTNAQIADDYKRLQQEFKELSEKVNPLRRDNNRLRECQRKALLLLRGGQVQDMSNMTMSQVHRIMKPAKGIRKALKDSFGNPCNVKLSDILERTPSQLLNRKGIGPATVEYLMRCANYSGLTWGYE